ncbi:MAG: TrkH family potassium uptake protein [Synergistaceae bacterium]|nr:TrkH family potassium uptake protein [Synergistaceae bacterium]
MRLVSRFLSVITVATTLAMSLPILMAAWSGDGGFKPLIMAFAAGMCASACLAFAGRGESISDMSARDAVLSVVVSWLAASALTSLPYIFSGAAPTVLDALFEGVSGFTTTGASVIANLDSVPKSIRLWRSFSEWIGGLGIIVLVLALLPSAGASGAGMWLYKAELSSPVHERMTPRIQQTAVILWKTYIALTAAQIFFLMLNGLDLYDSATLAFSTISTGGFSPYSDNVGHFNGNGVKWVTAVFLFLSGINLTLYHVLIVGRSPSRVWKSPETRFYVALFLAFGASVSIILYSGGVFQSVRTSLLEGFFYSISMISTCGFFISDYGTWPAVARFLMMVMAFCGGCAISTTGGLKCVRVVVIIKHVHGEFTRLLHQSAVVPTRLGGGAVDAEVVSACFAYLSAYMAALLGGFVLLTMLGDDPTAALSRAAAMISNTGPGFEIGRSGGPLPGGAGVKLVSMVLMLCGRLEIFTLLIIFTPRFWRR